MKIRTPFVLSFCVILVGCNHEEKKSADKEQTPVAIKAVPDPLPETIQPTPLPGRFERASWLDGARKLAKWTLQGKHYVVVGGDKWLATFHEQKEIARIAISGAVHSLRVIDGRLYCGIGRSRTSPRAKAAVQIFRRANLQGVENIPLPATTRADVVGFAPVAVGKFPWVASYRSKYQVQVSRLPPFNTQATLRVALGIDSGDIDGDGQRDALLARPYGDNKDLPGEIVVMMATGEKRTFPLRGGARALLWDSDGRIYVADGWDRHYAKKAKGLLSVIEKIDGVWKHRIIAHIKNRIGFRKILHEAITRDGERRLLVGGDGPVLLIAPSRSHPSLAHAYQIHKGSVDDFMLFDTNDDEQLELLMTGEESGIWHFAKFP